MVNPLSNLTRFTGVGVGLRWGQNGGGIDQTLEARQGSTTTSLGTVSGQHHLSLTIDLDTQTYSVAIDGVAAGSGLGFDNPGTVSTLDSVRFFTSNLNELNFSGRAFDNLVVSTAGAGNSPPVAEAGPGQNVQVGDTVNLNGGGSSDPEGATLTFLWELTTVPAGSTATLTGPNSATPSFVADLAGTYLATLVVNDGTLSDDDSVSITAGSGTGDILLSDDFNRPNSSTVGTGWVEVGQTGGNVAIDSNRLFFEDTSNILLRPLVRRSFSQPVSTGIIQWDFDFDWTQNAPDPGYELWMQLGDSNLMVNPLSNLTRFTGVGVGLRWGQNGGGIDQTLEARQGSTSTSLGTVSGLAHLSLTIDLDAQTYSVAIDGVAAGSGLGFDNPTTVTTLDTVRFFTSNVNELNFSGRAFDNLVITAE
jgi:hypothetical protein